jgi:hypothetical protein
MKRFLTFLHRSIGFIERAPLTLSHWATSFGALIVTRILIENWLGGFEDHSASFLFFEFTHTFFFFFRSYSDTVLYSKQEIKISQYIYISNFGSNFSV